MTTTDPRTVAYSVDDGVATVVLDRPDKLNAFTLAMGEELLAALDEIDRDDAVRAAVFTGRGRAYCAGADVADGTAIFGRESADFDMVTHADLGGVLSRRMLESTKPLIAAVNGPAVGIGVTSTLPMDARLASTTARFGFVFTRRGLVPEACSSWFLPRLVGMATAAEWVYSGRVFEADEALRAGLVQSLHAPDELLGEAYRLAHTMTDSSSPVAVAVARRMLWRMYADGTPERAHELDSRGIHHLGASPDCAEGVAAFLDRRPPAFPMTVSRDLPDYLG